MGSMARGAVARQAVFTVDQFAADITAPEKFGLLVDGVVLEVGENLRFNLEFWGGGHRVPFTYPLKLLYAYKG